LIHGDIEGLKIGQNTVYPFEGMITDGAGLAGAVIGLFRAEAEEFTEETAVQIAISDEHGYFAFRDVIFGNWIVREIASGNPAYTLNDTSFPITITEDGQVIEIVIENELIFGDVRGIKVNAADTDEVLAGAIFGLFHEDETELTHENALMIAPSAADGTFSFEGLPLGARLQLVELYAPEGFLRSDKAITIEVTEADQVIALVIENEPEPEAPEEPDEPEEEEGEPDKGTPNPPDQPNRPNQPPRAPQTGDDIQLPWLTLVLSLIGMLAMIGGVVWYKRRRVGNLDAE
jgi:LPXTG-motif cell wall-anchored protein